MDQVRIGSYIAQCRREKKWTQKELAKKLGVTDKSVSKWENGYCLPDPSLYQPLCDALEITPNDLFGEALKEKNERAVDKKMLEMLIYSIYKGCSDRITLEEFQNALQRMAEVALSLSQFPSKEEAVSYLMRETEGMEITREECEKAYDIYMQLGNTDVL